MKTRGSERLVTLFLIVAVIVAGWMFLSDLGHSKDRPAGAGDIWWTQVPLIEEVYQSIKNR
jgi:hypothetical protein